MDAIRVVGRHYEDIDRYYKNYRKIIIKLKNIVIIIGSIGVWNFPPTAFCPLKIKNIVIIRKSASGFSFSSRFCLLLNGPAIFKYNK